MRMERKYQQNREFGISGINLFLLSLGMFILLGPSRFFTEVTYGSQLNPTLKEEVKEAIQKLPMSLMDSVSKNDINAIQTTLNKIISDAEKEGKPIRFGIGILDRNGVAVTGRHIVRLSGRRISPNINL
jgi:hypothetical protein